MPPLEIPHKLLLYYPYFYVSELQFISLSAERNWDNLVFVGNRLMLCLIIVSSFSYEWLRYLMKIQNYFNVVSAIDFYAFSSYLFAEEREKSFISGPLSKWLQQVGL